MMKHNLNTLKRLIQCLIIQNRTFDHTKLITPWTQPIEISGREIIQNSDARTLADQSFDEVGPNETGTTGDTAGHSLERLKTIRGEV
jgi:hypothetical protein